MRFILLIGFLFLCASGCIAQQIDENQSQVSFQEILDKVMPIEQRFGLNIGFRTHESFYTETLEYSFLLSYNYQKDKVGIVMRTANNTSVYDQLEALRRQNGKAAIEDLKNQIKIKEQTLTENECPALKPLFFGFEKINFRPPSLDLIFIHPMIYEIKAGFGAGDMYLTFFEEKQSLVKWALKVKAIAARCTLKSKKPSVERLQLLISPR